MSLRALQTVPIFRIFDIAKAKEFYLDFLGFILDWEHRFEPQFPLYLQVSRGGFVLHYPSITAMPVQAPRSLCACKGLPRITRSF